MTASVNWSNTRRRMSSLAASRGSSWSGTALREGVQAREMAAVLLELVRAEELGPQGRFFVLEIDRVR